MKHRTAFPTLLVLSGALVAAGTATAGPRVGTIVGSPTSTSQTVQAKVISATPVVAQVAVPRQVCHDAYYQEPPRSSGAGAVLGAIVGGVVGNAVGKGGGRVLATGAGVIGGAVLGDHIENNGRPGTTRSVRQCEQQASYENQVVAYDVVYEYAGQRYSTQMDEEPGRTIPLQVTVNPIGSPAPVVAAPQPYYDQSDVGPATYYPPTPPGAVIYGGPPAPGWRGERYPGPGRGGWQHHRWD